MTYQELTKWAADAFERATREDGSHYYRIKEDLAPLSDEIDRDWLQEVVKDAHNGEMPSDWVYNQADNCFSFLNEHESLDEAGDEMYEHVEADPYHCDLLTWLMEDTSRATYVDDAVEEYGMSGDFSLFKAMAAGQHKQIEEIYSSIMSSIEDVELEEA